MTPKGLLSQQEKAADVHAALGVIRVGLQTPRLLAPFQVRLTSPSSVGSLAAAMSDGVASGCTNDPCDGVSGEVSYLCYVRSGTPNKQVEALAAQFCEAHAFADDKLKDIMTTEAQNAADVDCPPVADCYCAVASTGTHSYVQYLSADDADTLFKGLTRKDAKPLDPQDSNVPEDMRVYVQVNCTMNVGGKCAPRSGGIDK